MARWEPDARGRLQQAAMELFQERGYGEVTVAQIADRAGLTKRTFFNHFADKREVFFANAQMFEESVLGHLEAAAPDLGPIDAVVLALTHAGLELAPYYEFAKARIAVLAVTPELQERDLVKSAGTAVAVAQVLGRRGVPERTATFAAQAALSIFSVAAAEWITHPTADFPALMQKALGEFRESLSSG
ncbi:TetR/AcrR family transcriptional regulator [Kineosporia sp. NBRC 101731]|uniref:TetR/AcrR family transcriptional regulator n=1 Tax=Kineosporia sp. NBRC 101731 TaxID=3032199 RepID=UPI0024A48A01|nr:TetR/AcrR family transcriptional regulator [Kineosporia sp. NBRC 101731]GLY29162.1 TetR family transcriptional regulator [Kineosporia sp. NBRC 101731]